jgi:DNA-directed RNA polymerase specialized sigma24 family protein
VQDAFVRVARRLTHLRDPDAFGGYLRKTVVNLARSQSAAGGSSERTLRGVRRSGGSRGPPRVRPRPIDWERRWPRSPPDSERRSSFGSTRTSPSTEHPRSCAAGRAP